MINAVGTPQSLLLLGGTSDIAAAIARRYATRIHRDVDSADASGAAGTPTMFVNGRRHEGAHDIDGLAAAIERELASGL